MFSDVRLGYLFSKCRITLNTFPALILSDVYRQNTLLMHVGERFHIGGLCRFRWTCDFCVGTRS